MTRFLMTWLILFQKEKFFYPNIESRLLTYTVEVVLINLNIYSQTKLEQVPRWAQISGHRYPRPVPSIYISNNVILRPDLQDIKQNHWTINYRSLTYIIKFMPSIIVSHWSIILSIIFKYQTVFKILNKIAGLWNVTDLHIFSWGQSLCHTDPLYQVWHSSIK